MKKMFILGVLVILVLAVVSNLYAANLGEILSGAAKTTDDACRTGLAAIGRAFAIPLDIAKNMINAFSMGISNGETIFWD